jgi:alpha-beta hydrolase superfamily lysophospholipase
MYPAVPAWRTALAFNYAERDMPEEARVEFEILAKDNFSIFPRDGVTPADLRPIDRIGEQTAPVLVVAGTADPYTTRRESRELFERARAPKGLWEVEDAAHVDLHAFAPAEYEHRIGEFLAQNLRATSAGASGAVLLHGPSGLAGSD